MSQRTESKGAFINTFGTPDSTHTRRLLSADLILLWGVDLDAWPPQLSDYLVGARARGASVLLIHPTARTSVRPLSRNAYSTIRKRLRCMTDTSQYDRIAISRWSMHSPSNGYNTAASQNTSCTDTSTAGMRSKPCRPFIRAMPRTRRVCLHKYWSLFRDLKHLTDDFILGEQFCAPPRSRCDASRAQHTFGGRCLDDAEQVY